MSCVTLWLLGLNMVLRVDLEVVGGDVVVAGVSEVAAVGVAAQDAGIVVEACAEASAHDMAMTAQGGEQEIN